MTPSERIKHIRDIAKELSKEEWPLIDLTLKQFSLRWSNDNYGGDKNSYIIDMISDAPDQSLLGLAKHLGTASELEPVATPGFWSPNDARIFISHVSKIKEKTSQLKDALVGFGMRGFVAHEDIEPTKEWQAEIEAALSTMDALVALLSPGFNESKWCDQEVGVAIGRRVPIVPVKVDLDPYGLFGKYQAIQAKGKNPSEVAPQVYEALVNKPQTGPKITTQLVRMFQESRSWDQSRKLVSLIEKSIYLTPEHIAAMKKAEKENGEVRNAFGVPEKIDELKKRVGRS
jgi:hypothetical protein